jgi:serine/threonine-protein kinase RsbW
MKIYQTQQPRRILEKPNGRGVFLMRSLADEVEFFDDGARVELRFKL